MGLVLDLDLETNLGPSHEVFASIDSIRVNKTLAEVRFSCTYWLEESYSKRFFREYIEDELNNAKGQVSQNIIYYEDQSSDGEEITLPNFFPNIPLAKKVEVEVPTVEKVTVDRKVPYISFDENGNEISLEKTIQEEVEKITGYTKEERSLIDYSSINNIEDFCYIYLREELGKLLPIDKIKKV
jgi:hypothetical protein